MEGRFVDRQGRIFATNMTKPIHGSHRTYNWTGTLMACHTTPERATEAFGIYALSGKVTSFLAPFLIALATGLSGSQRAGIAPLILLFLAGLVLLVWVKPGGEQRAVT
jgi:UMF1 family MFS transporter